jgi:hypothetical protein
MRYHPIPRHHRLKLDCVHLVLAVVNNVLVPNRFAAGDILLSTKMLLILLFTRGLIVLLKRAAALRGARLFDVPMRNERYTAERRRRGIIITVDDVGVGAPNGELAPL